MRPYLTVPLEEVEITATRAQDAGGQNVYVDELSRHLVYVGAPVARSSSSMADSRRAGRKPNGPISP